MPREYKDALRTAEGLEQTSQTLEQGYQQAAAEAAWPLLRVTQDLSEAVVAAQREGDFRAKGGSHRQLTSSVLASNLESKLDKREGRWQCYFASSQSLKAEG